MTTNYCNFNLSKEYDKLDCEAEKYYSNECNKFLLKKELVEGECLNQEPDKNPYLYPELNDARFNIKIATKKEFNDTQYDGTVHANVKEYADILSNADFELSPHQAFVKNFLSSQTPYNSLLLYHMLGTGKTCSAIGVCEEMRDYIKQVGMTKRIIIVASENVQNNFKLQLFDERKLKLIDGLWNIKGCVGNKLLNEINPMNMKGITREKIINQIKNLINAYYLFLGYGQFANYIIKTMNYNEEIEREREQDRQEQDSSKKPKTQIQAYKDIKVTLNKRVIRRLKNEFDNRLIVIDEIHNIRKSDNAETKRVAINLEYLVKSAENMRFLLLSATPMYNSYKEIIWLLNLMNINDRRAKIDVSDVFEKDGSFKPNGEEMLIRKATGYVSYVRGENPYIFPYRVYPNIFAPKNTFPHINYPSYQMNLHKIKDADRKRILSLYLTTIDECSSCGECQGCVYKYIIHNLRNKQFTITTKKGVVKEMPSFENMESFGYTLLQTPLESLIMSYPMDGLKHILDTIPAEKYTDEYSEDSVAASTVALSIVKPKTTKPKPKSKKLNIKEAELMKHGGDDSTPTDEVPNTIDPHKLTGKQGLERVMDYTDEKSPPQKTNFAYKKATLQKHGRIFSRETIGKYSAKIKNVLEMIYNTDTNKVSDGIILIYSQYIDAGLIPMALALEEMGFTRYGDKAKTLFKTKPTDVVDARTMKPPTDRKDFLPARYTMITGDKGLSPNNDFEVKGVTNDNNKDGHRIKVILISRAGSEGIDLKFIRQVHILDPWYNMNRLEQIIGRAVRNLSHKDLEFEKRNVEIFMYGTILGKENKEESADLYVYRLAELKAVQMGKISRILKETAVDCIINHDQTNFTHEKMSKLIDTPITQDLSTGLVIKDFKIGDVPYSSACDYMATCDYKCRPDATINPNELNEDTYDESFIFMNSDKILQKIRMLMKESFFYKKDVLISAIQTPKPYPYVQIYAALSLLIDDNNEFIVDKYGRNGRLVNIGEYYLFQPIELKDKHISIFERSMPIDYKHEMIELNINESILKPNRPVGETKLEYKKAKKLVENLLVDLNYAKEFASKPKVPRGDDIWYKHCGVAMQKMTAEYPGIKQYLIPFLIDHMIESLFYDEKLELLNYIYSLDNMANDSLELLAKQYFERNVIISNNSSFCIMYNLNRPIILVLNDDNTWVATEPEDTREFLADPLVKEFFTYTRADYNKYVGFIGYKKNNTVLVFKSKDMDSSRDTGATCEEAGKDKSIQKLNGILGEDKYTKENTKSQKDADGNITQEAIGQIELCVLQEFILRYFNTIKKNGKKWFLTPELAIGHKLYKVIV
jgi:hypothetical protein